MLANCRIKLSGRGRRFSWLGHAPPRRARLAEARRSRQIMRGR